ncbi:sulfite oxidase heme-binding subunit YedZ [Campylobacter upsaliensis]|nr:sulfite oxidase heme-binding subunit YedZ [Campylobacter upsaliensis]
MKRLKAKFYKNLAFFAFILSLIFTTYAAVYNVFFVGFDLIKELYFYTGIFALVFLHLSIIFSLFKFKPTKTYPKLLGLFGGIWVFLHFIVYFVFSKNLSLLKLYDDISKRLFEGSGFVAFVIIFLMFLSSFKTFKKLENVRKLGYLCIVIASYHYFLSAKVPQFFEYLALSLALFYFTLRYTKRFFTRLKGA